MVFTVIQLRVGKKRVHYWLGGYDEKNN
jgi:hypothetical protein